MPTGVVGSLHAGKLETPNYRAMRFFQLCLAFMTTTVGIFRKLHKDSLQVQLGI